jgi:hypothetical protein
MHRLGGEAVASSLDKVLFVFVHECNVAARACGGRALLHQRLSESPRIAKALLGTRSSQRLRFLLIWSVGVGAMKRDQGRRCSR